MCQHTTAWIRRAVTRGGVWDIGAPVVATLTTIPSRIGLIRPTLDSLVRQTRPPDEVVVVVPRWSKREDRAYEVPAWLDAYCDRYVSKEGPYLPPRVRVQRVEEDYGPATKLIPVLREMQGQGRGDACLIVVDDDRVYGRTMVSNLLRYGGAMPDHVVCNRGHRFDETGRFDRSCVLIGPSIDEPQAVDVVTGVGGFLVRPRFLDERLWDYRDAPEGAYYMDDVWISGCLARRGVGRVVVPTQSPLLTPSVRDRRGTRLSRSNRLMKGTPTLNDIPMDRAACNERVVMHFAGDW